MLREHEHDTSSHTHTKLPEENKAPETCAKDEEEQYYSNESPAHEKPSEPEKVAVVTEKAPLPEIKRERVSGLSLKSIHKKKEIAAKQKAMMPAEEVMDEAFTEEDMVHHWQQYTEKLKKKGEKILASILESQTPILEEKQILLTFPNETMKLDLQKEEPRMMGYLKKKLKNTHISLKIIVDEATSRKYAFTPQEKYEKLKESNPLIDKLRATFDLDV